jgi:hypothetical protein
MLVHMLRFEVDDDEDDTEDASKLSNDVVDDEKTPLSQGCLAVAFEEGDDSLFVSFGSPCCAAAA